MPKTPRDFSKGLIYTIVCKTDETLLYVGSTTNLTQRKNLHKKACINEKHKDHNLQVYVMIRANGGWDSFEMKPVKEHPCDNKIQLVIEEERIRKEMKANLNTNRAYITPEEHKEQIKEWNKNNAEYVAEQQKQYYQKNAEQILERTKQHYEKNKQQISDQRKQHYEKNKEQINERRRIKRQELKNAL